LFLKRAFSLFLSLLIGAQSVQAREGSSIGTRVVSSQIAGYMEATGNMWYVAPNVTFDRKVNTYDLDPLLEQTKRSNFQLPGGIVHTSQTMLQMFLVAYGTALYQNWVRNQAAGKHWSEHWYETLGDTAKHVGASFDIYAGFLGGFASSAVLRKPIESLVQNLQANPAAKAKFAGTLHKGAMSFAQMVSFESFMQLVQEAIYSLKDQEEIAIAKNLDFYKLLTTPFDASVNNAKAQRERVVFAKILMNMFLIMTFLKPATTKRWVYNTWRRLNTGEFVVMTLCFSAGATIGAKAGFWAGTKLGPVGSGLGATLGGIGGFILGTAAGYLSIYVPQEYKDPITIELQDNRARIGFRELENNKKQLYRIANAFGKDHSDPSTDLQKYGPMLSAIYARDKISKSDFRALEANALEIVQNAYLFDFKGSPDINRQNSLLRVVYARDQIPTSDQEGLKKNGQEIMKVISSPVPSLFKKYLEQRRNFRSNIVTIYMERYSVALTRMKEAQGMINQMNNENHIGLHQKVLLLEDPTDMKRLLDLGFKSYSVKDQADFMELYKKFEQKRDEAAAMARSAEEEILKFYDEESRNQIGAMLYDDTFKDQLKLILDTEMKFLDGLHMTLRTIFAGQFPERAVELGVENNPDLRSEKFKMASNFHIDGNSTLGFNESAYYQISNIMVSTSLDPKTDFYDNQ